MASQNINKETNNKTNNKGANEMKKETTNNPLSVEAIEERKKKSVRKQVKIGYTVKTTFSTLEMATSTLKQFQSYGNGLMLGICYTLHRVDTDKLYKGSYKSTADYANATLGYDKSAVSRYIKVGSHVIPTENGYIWDKTIPALWNVTKASEALPLLKEDEDGINNAIKKGVLSENSTAKEIRGVARGTKAAKENVKTYSQLLNSKELSMNDIEMLSIQIYKGLLKLQSIGIECIPPIVTEFKNGLNIIDEADEADENDEADEA